MVKRWFLEGNLGVAKAKKRHLLERQARASKSPKMFPYLE